MATPLDIAAYSASLVNWSELGHVYCFGNGKGGVGKTTCTCNIGGLAAADGLRVLIVDLNVQGNVAEELGYAETELDDEGKGLLTAITLQEAVKPIRNVRPNLDVVPEASYCVGCRASSAPRSTIRNELRPSLLWPASSSQWPRSTT
ncbi:hypothetical protein SALBM311S_02818 [Streptomyces alboniger]